MPRPRVGDSASDQDIYESRSTASHKVGTRGFLDDGRVYYYSRIGAADLDPGKLAMAEVIAATQANLAVTATTVGSKVVNVTPGAVTHNANVFAEGYLCVNDVAGEGHTYKIRNHPAIASATAFDLTLYDEIQVALTASSQVTLVKNPWADVVVAAAGKVHMAVGIPQVALTAAEYGWIQTWGVTCGLDNAATAIGDSLQSGTDEGKIEVGAEGAGTLGALIGVQLYTGVDTEYYPKFLQIAP